MARLHKAAKSQSRISPKTLVRSIVTLLFMSCILNFLYLTRLQESEHNAWGVVGVRQLQTSIIEAKNPPEPRSAGSDIEINEQYFSPRKERVLALLREAGIANLDNSTVAALPTWNEISQLYGGSQSPIVYGLDTCASYRDTVPEHERHAAVAGMFNTGTNAIAWSLSHNINTSRPNFWQVRTVWRMNT
jgi:hypothetical protein